MNFATLWQPHKRRVYQVKKKINGKAAFKPAQKDILYNRVLPDGNEDEIEEQDLQKWAMKSIAFLNNSTEWGNDKNDSDWAETQKKIQESVLVEPSKLTKNLLKDNKIVLLQASELSPLLLSAENEAAPFSDIQFLPNQLSLTGEWGFMQKYKNVYWNRATQEIKNCTIFDKKISPKDPIQGKLGDCYFLAGVAALAERPDRIFNLFLVRQITKKRNFSVKMLVKGIWRIIDLDEFLPFQNHKPVFSHLQRSELWVMILEKAWAKIYSCYMGISSGNVQQILHDFTGAPIKFFKLKNKDNVDKQALWKYLLKASKKEYAMCASSNAGSDEKMSQTGIVQGHAYTILNATILVFQGKKVKLLQLRNPWARKQNLGPWGDRDPNWKKVPPQQKKRLRYFQTLNDGVFYIQFEDFIREYRAVTIAQINDNASYVYQSLKDPNIEGVFFKVETKENGLYSFQVDKTPKRFFTSKKQIGYKYPNAVVKIFNSSEHYKEIHHFQDRQRLTSRRYSLFKGLYIVYVVIDFNKKFQTDYDVTLAIYSEGPADIEIANKNDIKHVKLPIINKQGHRTRISRSRPKDKSEEKKVRSPIRFNYLSPAKEYLAPVSNDQVIKDTIKNAVKMQIKNKRINKGQIIHIGGKKPKLIIQQDSNQNQENQIEGQGWINQQAQKHSSTLIDGIGKSLFDVINKQVTFIEPCPQNEKVQESKLVNRDFIDQRFPPSLSSLTGQWGQLQQWKNVRWQRISKMMPNAKIFQGKISPQSIKQGFLGDCYFLAGIAAIAERPDRIFNLFLQHQRNSSNSYSVKMLYKGKWLTISMDDYVPYMYDLPAFSRANKDELWVILLQKAWAKIYSSFKRIQAGFPQETLHDLTGAPIRHVYLQRSTFDMNKQWEYLMNASALEYAMVASSQAGSDQLKSLSGIVQGHAYTLLKVTDISINNNLQRLVQLRNPWGKGESSGRWGDNDPIWNTIDQKTKVNLGYSKMDDGIFFMTYENFCKQFKIITIAEINDNASYVYKSAKDPQKNGCFFKVQILQKGKYSFQVDSTPQRTFEIKYNTNYRYPYIKFELGMMTDQGYIRRITSMQQNSRTSFYGSEFDVGVYICFVRIDFDPKFQKDFDVNLAIYGDYVSYVELASKKQAVLFSNNPNIKWGGSEPLQKTEVQWNALRGYRRDRRSK